MAIYFRRLSRTQTLETAVYQTRSEEIWGTRPVISGLFDCVKAYIGPLPAGSTGIEFETSVAPSRRTPVEALWDAHVVPQVVPAGKPNYVKLRVKMRRVVYPSPNPLLNVSCTF